MTKAGEKISWKFRSVNDGIGFGLFWKPIGHLKTVPVDQMRELLPIRFFLSNTCQDVDDYVCTQAGVFVLVFSNPNWFSDTTIIHACELIQT